MSLLFPFQFEQTPPSSTAPSFPWFALQTFMVSENLPIEGVPTTYGTSLATPHHTASCCKRSSDLAQRRGWGDVHRCVCAYAHMCLHLLTGAATRLKQDTLSCFKVQGLEMRRLSALTGSNPRRVITCMARIHKLYVACAGKTSMQASGPKGPDLVGTNFGNPYNKTRASGGSQTGERVRGRGGFRNRKYHRGSKSIPHINGV